MQFGEFVIFDWMEEYIVQYMILGVYDKFFFFYLVIDGLLGDLFVIWENFDDLFRVVLGLCLVFGFFDMDVLQISVVLEGNWKCNKRYFFYLGVVVWCEGFF